MNVQSDRFSIALLILRPDAPVLDDEAAACLQDAHMAISPISMRQVTSWLWAHCSTRSFVG